MPQPKDYAKTAGMQILVGRDRGIMERSEFSKVSKSAERIGQNMMIKSSTNENNGHESSRNYIDIICEYIYIFQNTQISFYRTKKAQRDLFIHKKFSGNRTVT